jgi:hypothetical protein
VLWLLAIISIGFGVTALVNGGLGHAVSGGGALLISAIPAFFMFIFGMACYSGTRDTSNKTAGEEQQHDR